MLKSTLGCVFVWCVMSWGQDTLYFEGFEGDSSDVLFENYSSDVMNHWPASCGSVGLGGNSDFDSEDVDFDISSNHSQYMGLNVHSPCGGYYTAHVQSQVIDPTGYDSITVIYDLFQTQELWVSRVDSVAILEVIPKDSSVSLPIYQFYNEGLAREQWGTLTYSFPVDSFPEGFYFFFKLAGGQGMGIDNFTVLAYPELTTSQLEPSVHSSASTVDFTYTSGEVHLSGMPQGALLQVHDVSGKQVLTQNIVESQESLSLQHLDVGVYWFSLSHPELSQSLRYQVLHQ